MTFEKRKLIMKTFVESQFNYCPLVWMFHNRTLNHKINRMHERALRVVYQNEDLSFQELLNIDNTPTIHQKNLRKLATEMYKVKNNLSPSPVVELFINHTDSYNLRNRRCWEHPNTRTVAYGTETISYRGPKTWELIPRNIKDSSTLAEFKHKIKQWLPDSCECRLCKVFIHHLGYI